MNSIRRLFKRNKKKKGSSKPKGGNSRGSRHYRKNASSASTDSSASQGSILERTRIHVATVVEGPASSPSSKQVFSDLHQSSFDAASIIAEEHRQQHKAASECDPSGGLLWCHSPAAGGDDAASSSTPGGDNMSTKKSSLETTKAKTEAIECVFSEYRKSQHEFVPSLIESLSSQETSITDTQNEKLKGCLLDMTEVPRIQPCRCGLDCLPPNPEGWPQAPLLFRPDPKSGTKIIGIRKENNSEYLWKPEDGSSTSWWRELHKQWGTKKDENIPEAPSCCPRCVVLPINNGNEKTGETLVADFESTLFRGTIMLRLRHAEGTTKQPSDDTKGCFAGVPFRHEAVIRGNFKKELPFTELHTGTKLSRPCGKLPPKWVMWSALKVISFFAPQLKAELDIDKPYVLTPLGSGPRVVEVDRVKPTDFLADERLEPSTAGRSLTGKSYNVADHLLRARARKKHFDQLYIAKDKRSVLWTDQNKTYTMQFLQHLFDYQNFSIDLGSMHLDCKELLGGQPMQLMASHGEKLLWSFEIWNESLFEDAKRNAFTERNIGWTVTYQSNHTKL